MSGSSSSCARRDSHCPRLRDDAIGRRQGSRHDGRESRLILARLALSPDRIDDRPCDAPEGRSFGLMCRSRITRSLTAAIGNARQARNSESDDGRRTTMKAHLLATLAGGVLAAVLVAPIGSVDSDCPASLASGCPSFTTLLVGIRLEDPYPGWLPTAAALFGALVAVTATVVVRFARRA